MTLEEAKNVIYANVIYACEKASLSPSTIAIVKDACDTVIALAEQADTLQTDIHGLTDCDFCKEKNCEDCEGGKDEPQTDCGANLE